MHAAGKAEKSEASGAKAMGILLKMIDIATNEGDIVFDPFMGVGSMGVAALRKKENS